MPQQMHQGNRAHICICSAIPKPLVHFLFSHCSQLPCLETVSQSAIWVLLSTWDDLSAILTYFRYREYRENTLIGGKKWEGHKKAIRSFGKNLEVKLVRQKYKTLEKKKKNNISRRKNNTGRNTDRSQQKESISDVHAQPFFLQFSVLEVLTKTCSK